MYILLKIFKRIMPDKNSGFSLYLFTHSCWRISALAQGNLIAIRKQSNRPTGLLHQEVPGKPTLIRLAAGLFTRKAERSIPGSSPLSISPPAFRRTGTHLCCRASISGIGICRFYCHLTREALINSALLRAQSMW